MRNKFINKIFIITLGLIFTLTILVLTIPRLGYEMVNDGYSVLGSLGINHNIYISKTHFNKPIVEIGVRAFENKRIDSFIFEQDSNVEKISRRSFYNTKLSYIEIPSSVRIIEQNAFSYSTIEEININGNNLEAISGSTFFNCTNLKSIVIPTSVESIGSLAFFNCINLKDIYINNKLKIYDKAFYGCDITIHTKCPLELLSGYDTNATIKIVYD